MNTEIDEAIEYFNESAEHHPHLKTLIQAAKRVQWKPIETIPPMTKCILTFDFTSVYAGQLEDGLFMDGNWEVHKPTHWMPLPPSPEKE